MSTLICLVNRNIKIFFKDKGMLFTSLITPIILMVLYVTFLGKVYTDSFSGAVPPGFDCPKTIIDAIVGGELVSSLLAVSCVTVAFCSNMVIVQDKMNGIRNDFFVTPVKRSTLALSYFIATEICTLIVSLIALTAGLVYLWNVGWYVSILDIVLLIGDVVLLTMFGTALSSIINLFISTEGQKSAVGTIISAGYGFICGAYMPISNFSEPLQKFVSFLPGTYGTSLVRNHLLQGTFKEMTAIDIPNEILNGIKDSIDCRLYFLDHLVTLPQMAIIMIVTVVSCIIIYILLNTFRINH